MNRGFSKGIANVSVEPCKELLDSMGILSRDAYEPAGYFDRALR